MSIYHLHSIKKLFLLWCELLNLNLLLRSLVIDNFILNHEDIFEVSRIENLVGEKLV